MSAKRCASAALGRVLDRDEDLAHVVLGLPGLRLEQAALLVDLGVADVALRPQLLAQHPGPAELDANLVDQRPERHPAAAQALAQRTLLHAVARLDLADRLGDVAVAHRDLAPLHLLQPQPLVDQLPRHLRPQPVQHLRRHRHPGAQREQPAPILHIGIGDHVAIDHRDDLLGRRHRRLRRRRGRPLRQPRLPRLGLRGQRQRHGGAEEARGEAYSWHFLPWLVQNAW